MTNTNAKMLHYLFFSPKVVKISCWMNCFFPPEIVEVPLATMFLKSKKKILRLTPQNFVLRTGLPHTDLSSVGLRFGFFGHFPTEGTEVKSASVTQTEVDL